MLLKKIEQKKGNEKKVKQGEKMKKIFWQYL